MESITKPNLDQFLSFLFLVVFLHFLSTSFWSKPNIIVCSCLTINIKIISYFISNKVIIRVQLNYDDKNLTKMCVCVCVTINIDILSHSSTSNNIIIYQRKQVHHQVPLSVLCKRKT